MNCRALRLNLGENTLEDYISLSAFLLAPLPPPSSSLILPKRLFNFTPSLFYYSIYHWKKSQRFADSPKIQVGSSIVRRHISKVIHPFTYSAQKGTIWKGKHVRRAPAAHTNCALCSQLLISWNLNPVFPEDLISHGSDSGQQPHALRSTAYLKGKCIHKYSPSAVSVYALPGSRLGRLRTLI